MTKQVLLLLFLVHLSLQVEYTTYNSVVQNVRISQDHIVMVWTTSSNKNCARCAMGNDILDDFKRDNPYVKIYAIDCEKTNVEMKQFQERIKQVCSNSQLLPHITIFEQKSDDITKKWPQDHIYSGVVVEHQLLDYLDGLMLNYVQNVDSLKQLSRILQDKKAQHKVVLITSSEQIPLYFKALSVEFRAQNIDFLMVDRDNKKIMSKFPSALSDQDSLIYYKNAENQVLFDSQTNSTNYDKISKFINIQLGTAEPDPEAEVTNPNLETRQLQYTELKKYLNKRHDNWVMLQITSKNKHTDELPAFKAQFEEFFKYAHIQCRGIECKEYVQDSIGIVDKLPLLLIYPLGRKQVNSFVRIDPTFTFDQITELLLNYVTPAEQTLNQYQEKVDSQEHVEGFIKKNLDDFKFPLIWFYESKHPFQKLMLHTFSNNEISDPNKETVETYNLVNGYPEPIAFLEIDGGTYKKATMTNKERKFSHYVEYIQNLHNRKLSQKLDKVPIHDINKPEKFDEICNLPDKPCIIGVLSTYTGKNKQEMEILETSKNSFSRDYNWGWIDGNCHKEFLRSVFLKSQRLSTVLYYNRKKNKFIAMEDELTQENLDFFLQSLNKRSVLSKMIRMEEVEIEDTDWKCQRINEELKIKQKEERKAKLEEQHKKYQEKQQENEKQEDL